MPRRNQHHERWTTSPPASSSSGSDMMLGSLIGQLIASQQMSITAQHVSNDLLHGVIDGLERLPDQIAAKLPKPTNQETSPSSPQGEVIDLMKALKDLIWSLLPLAMLASIAAGKVTWPQALPIIRQLLGIH